MIMQGRGILRSIFMVVILGLYLGYDGVIYTPRMENQMENKTEKEMGTTIV